MTVEFILRVKQTCSSFQANTQMSRQFLDNGGTDCEGLWRGLSDIIGSRRARDSGNQCHFLPRREKLFQCVICRSVSAEWDSTVRRKDCRGATDLKFGYRLRYPRFAFAPSGARRPPRPETASKVPRKEFHNSFTLRRSILARLILLRIFVQP